MHWKCYCNMKAKNKNTKCQESLTRKVPGRNAHLSTLHKHNMVQVTACILKPDKQATIQPSSYCQKLALMNNSISTRSGTIWKLSDLHQQVGSQLLFGTDAITYGCKFVPTTAKPLVVYTTEWKLQKIHVQYRFMDAVKN